MAASRTASGTTPALSQAGSSGLDSWGLPRAGSAPCCFHSFTAGVARSATRVVAASPVRGSAWEFDFSLRFE